MSNDRDNEIADLRRRLDELEREAMADTELHPRADTGLASSVAPKDRTPLYGLIAVIVLFVLLVAYCSSQSGSTPAVTADSGATEIQQEIAASVAGKPMGVVSQTSWTYREDVDAMTDKQTHFACVTSSNEVRLAPPYSDVRAELCIRQSPRYGLDAYIRLLGDGQIICRSYNNCAVKVRFGDGAQQSFSATDSADGSSNITFFTNASRFVSGAQTADVTRVQMTFYQAGDQVVEFNTKGLEWPRPTG